MKRTLTLLVLAGVLPLSSHALESATVGSQATQATVNVLNTKIDSLMAALQAMVNGMSTCNAQRKFYAPSDPKKDVSGCVGIQDYQLTMNGTNGVNTPSGQVAATNSSGWSGNFNGAGGLLAAGTSSPGIQGSSTSSYGVYGSSSGNWSGVFSGSSGVYGQGGASGWGGYFVGSSGVYGQGSAGWSVEGVGGPYGVYGQGSSWAGYFVGPVYANTNVQTPALCLNGDCRSSWPGGGHGFGGIYALTNGVCTGSDVNPFTGGCSCPGGYTAAGAVASGQFPPFNQFLYFCYN